MQGHLAWHRLEVVALTVEEKAHLATCPRCRCDRRELRHSLHGTLSLKNGGDASPASHSDQLSSSGYDLIARALELRHRGWRLGDYAVDALVGVGGMAVVYLAHHVRRRTRHALKVLATPGRDAGRRLMQEGHLQARLHNPHVVRVTDVIIDSDMPALVLEYVNGPSLAQVLEHTELELSEADALAVDILTGMSAAHARGFVHRDLKPSNIMVEATTERAVAKVSDFGLARVVSGDLTSLHTATGARLGTLVYMAPEQIRDASQADQGSDVFALGALLYELVTGRRCFGGADLVDIVQRITTGTRDPLPDGIPARMERAIDQALHIDPSLRPADASALLATWTEGRTEASHRWAPSRLATLQHLVDLQPLPAPPSAARLRWPVAAMGVVAVSAAGGMLIWTKPPPDQGAVMLVQDHGGAPGRPPHTRLTAAFSPDLNGLYTAECIAAGHNCATVTPAPDEWAPLVPPPQRSLLTSPVSAVALGGLEARFDGTSYVAEGVLSEDVSTLSLDSISVDLEWMPPSSHGLKNDATEVVRVGPQEGITVRWTPGGAGTPFLEVRPRSGTGGRIYALEDDGSFALPADALGAVPSQTDLVFGRQVRAEPDLARPIQLVARSQRWLTVVRVEDDRHKLPGIGNCEETKYRPPLDAGRYWSTFDRIDDPPQPADWTCTGGTLHGWAAVHSVRVPATGSLGVFARQVEGNPALWLASNPHCYPVDCIDGANRPGTTEALIIPSDGIERIRNLGIQESVPAGGLFLLDVVKLADPTEQHPVVSWTPEGMSVHLEHPADVQFRFGLAETQSNNGWYGEDCQRGNVEPHVSVCHEFEGADLTLRRIALPEQTRAGETTLFWSEIGRSSTFFLEATNLRSETGAATCWVWGDAPAYYGTLGCETIAGLEAPESASP